jgi:hypothetical protein
MRKLLQKLWLRFRLKTSCSKLTLIILAILIAQATQAQPLEVKRYNPSEWTKGRFSEVVTVTGPGKMIFLS